MYTLNFPKINWEFTPCYKPEIYFMQNTMVFLLLLPCTIVAIGHGLLKKFWPFGTRLRSTHCREFNYNLSIMVLYNPKFAFDKIITKIIASQYSNLRI